MQTPHLYLHTNHLVAAPSYSAGLQGPSARLLWAILAPLASSHANFKRGLAVTHAGSSLDRCYAGSCIRASEIKDWGASERTCVLAHESQR